MKNTNKIILFDIDRTLFDTDKFSRTTLEHLRVTIGCSAQDMAEQKRIYMDALVSNVDFSPEHYVEHLARSFGVAIDPLRKIMVETPHLYAESIFDESIEILQQLSQNYRLGIYSEGHLAFQTLKITHTGIIDHIEQSLTFIEPRKTTSDVQQKIPKQVIIVDDKISIVETLATWEHVKPIWINRYSNDKHAHIPTIHTLHHVVGLLHSL